LAHICTPGNGGFDALRLAYAEDPFPNVMYVFDPMNTLEYETKLKVVVNPAGKVI
jgi:hypothetical protein